MADEPNADVVTNPQGDDGKPAGTPPAGTQNADPDDNQKKLMQTLQEKAARVNAAEREAAELKAENERLKRAQTPAGPTPGVDSRQQRLRETFAWAQGQKDAEGRPDPVAGAVIDLATDTELLRQRLLEKEALDDIYDKDLRKQVREHLDTNRRQGREIDVAAAKAEIESREAEELREENRRLTEALRVAQAPAGTAPPTHHQPVPASTLKARQFDTLEDYEQSKRGMSTFERLAMDEKLEKGEVVVKRQR